MHILKWKRPLKFSFYFLLTRLYVLNKISLFLENVCLSMCDIHFAAALTQKTMERNAWNLHSKLLFNTLFYFKMLLMINTHTQNNFIYISDETIVCIPLCICFTSGGVVLRSKLLDRRCRVQFLVVLVNLASRSFPWFLRNSRKYGLWSFKMTSTKGTLRIDMHTRTLHA